MAHGQEYRPQMVFGEVANGTQKQRFLMANEFIYLRSKEAHVSILSGRIHSFGLISSA